MSFQETRCRKNFYNQVKLSGRIPQICLLFGPSAAGGAYIPAFCDIVVMVDGNASMYLGSPRMAEMVIGEKCPSKKWEAPVCIAQSQVGDILAKLKKKPYVWHGLIYRTFRQIIKKKRPCKRNARQNTRHPACRRHSAKPKCTFDMHELIERVIDEGSFLKSKLYLHQN